MIKNEIYLYVSWNTFKGWMVITLLTIKLIQYIRHWLICKGNQGLEILLPWAIGSLNLLSGVDRWQDITQLNVEDLYY